MSVDYLFISRFVHHKWHNRYFLGSKGNESWISPPSRSIRVIGVAYGVDGIYIILNSWPFLLREYRDQELQGNYHHTVSIDIEPAVEQIWNSLVYNTYTNRKFVFI